MISRKTYSLIEAYERNLEDKGLANIPFHAGPLMYGKGPYRDIDLADYLCAIELVGIKFDAHEINATDE
ncbi:MAG: hypothetical protein ACI36W_01340 [Coriobacteriales bacterium]